MITVYFRVNQAAESDQLVVGDGGVVVRGVERRRSPSSGQRCSDIQPTSSSGQEEQADHEGRRCGVGARACAGAAPRRAAQPAGRGRPGSSSSSRGPAPTTGAEGRVARSSLAQRLRDRRVAVGQGLRAASPNSAPRTVGQPRALRVVEGGVEVLGVGRPALGHQLVDLHQPRVRRGVLVGGQIGPGRDALVLGDHLDLGLVASVQARKSQAGVGVLAGRADADRVPADERRLAAVQAGDRRDPDLDALLLDQAEPGGRAGRDADLAALQRAEPGRARPRPSTPARRRPPRTACGRSRRRPPSPGQLTRAVVPSASITSPPPAQTDGQKVNSTQPPQLPPKYVPLHAAAELVDRAGRRRRTPPG